MESSEGTFPFGQPIQRVKQDDRSPKRVFVLGVYASAVHARWSSNEGKQLVRALAVASEPYIFWRGEDADQIISRIKVPGKAGRLKPAGGQLNGPSGRSLDQHYLKPLGLSREDAWLCDLVPHSCKNPGQDRAVTMHYSPLVAKMGLPPVEWPKVPARLDDARAAEIAAELDESNAEIVITLGDQPLRWFTSTYGSHNWLRQYGETPDAYGRLHAIEMEGRSRLLLPLVHPRQAARLGAHSKIWANVHSVWVNDRARTLLP